MLQGKKILFITTVNMAANPRCLKEIKSVYAKGADVTVVKFLFDNWSNDYEAAIEKSLPGVTWSGISATRKPLTKWLSATVVNILCRRLLPLMAGNTAMLAYSLDKRSVLLQQKLKKMAGSFDFVVAHNPGAFYPAAYYAAKHNIPLGIDVEDYHPGENAQTAKQMVQLMAKTLNSAHYITAASPLILEYTLRDIKQHAKTAVVNNVFSLKEQPAFKDIPSGSGHPLKLFWFSQHIDTDRGIEDAIDAMNVINAFSITLTLMGNCPDAVQKTFINRLVNERHKIIFKAPMPQAALIKESADHHIGLALEKSPNLNRALCLTNKIFTYLLSGNAIIASDTPAQKRFLDTYPQVGIVYQQNNVAQLADILSALYNDAAKLEQQRKASYMLSSHTLNWESEESVFLSLLN